MLDFDGIWIPLVTPFQAAEVDHAALRRLVQHLAAQGVAGFVACGSTGEAAMLGEAEQACVLATTLDAASGKPVLMGLAGVDAAAIAGRAQALAEQHRPAGWLLAPPAYVKPSQAGIVQHFHTVASATPLPLVAYDVPARTGVRIQAGTLLALAEHPQIRAVKDCSADRAAAEAVLADGRLALLGGNDDELFDQLARGAAGAITASAHLATGAFVRLAALLRAGGLAEARALWRQLAPLTQAAFAEPNPAVIKGALARQDRLADVLRPPMLPAARASVDSLLAAAAGL
ncbi:MAG: 4-hydroxy-tetrahydrodipicolinate synthase [Pseudomonadota bacterium]